MNAQQAIKILQQLPPNTEVGLWLGTQVPSQPIPSWPTMPQPNIQGPWHQFPYVVTCKHETQTH